MKIIYKQLNIGVTITFLALVGCNPVIVNADNNSCKKVFYAENGGKYINILYDKKDLSIEEQAFLKLFELNNYANKRIPMRYIPRGLNKQQVLQIAEQVFRAKGLDVNKINPLVIQSSILGKFYELADIMLDHGMNFKCYSQKNSANFLSNFFIKEKSLKPLRNKILEKILQAGVDPNEVKLNPDDDEAVELPINMAVTACDQDWVKILLKYGANPNLKINRENFPVFNVCKFPSSVDEEKDYQDSIIPIMTLLLDHGVFPNSLYDPKDIRTQYSQEDNALLQKTCHGKIQYMLGSYGRIKSVVSLYDYYKIQAKRARNEGFMTAAKKYTKVTTLIAKRGGKPLKVLCSKLKKR